MRWVAPLGEYDLKTGPHEIAEIEALTRERWEGPGLGLRRWLRPHGSLPATPWQLPGTRRRQRSELRTHPKEEAMSHALATVRRDGRRPSASAC